MKKPYSWAVWYRRLQASRQDLPEVRYPRTVAQTLAGGPLRGPTIICQKDGRSNSPYTHLPAVGNKQLPKQSTTFLHFGWSKLPSRAVAIWEYLLLSPVPGERSKILT